MHDNETKRITTITGEGHKNIRLDNLVNKITFSGANQEKYLYQSAHA
jgi:hypothetical protein